MKTLFLILFFLLIPPVFAESIKPSGLFQIDEARSKVSGLIDIKPNFTHSTLRLESSNSSFESREISGTLDQFTVKGLLQQGNSTREIEIIGKYFGTIDKENGLRRLALKLENSECKLQIFAHQPSTSATALHQEVRNIIQ